MFAAVFPWGALQESEEQLIEVAAVVEAALGGDFGDALAGVPQQVGAL